MYLICEPFLFIAWMMPYWMRESVMWVYERFDYLDLIMFGVGASIVFGVFFFLFKRKKRICTQLLSEVSGKHNKKIKELKRELNNLEMKYVKELNKQKNEYQENMQYAKKKHSKCMQDLQTKHTKIYFDSDVKVFELEQEVKHLRSFQLDEWGRFQEKIEELKKNIASLNENHAREIEKAALEIQDLRKQLQALMYKA